jgi:NAD(P)-dependent dehydrogenase (short-subunit alcohol dehydrogenase family)
MNKQRDLEGLTALVTGATSGIGRGAAYALGRHGAEVVVDGRDVTRDVVVVDAIAADGGKARFAAAELSPAGVRVNTIAAGPVYTPIPANRASRNRQRHHHHGAGRPA